MVTLYIEVALLIACCVYLACALLYVHRNTIRKMNFGDLTRRLGPSAFYLSIALACVLLVLGIAPEWRLPPIVLSGLLTAIGLTRDVRRERAKRRNWNDHHPHREG